MCAAMQVGGSKRIGNTPNRHGPLRGFARTADIFKSCYLSGVSIPCWDSQSASR